ncbi:hypothetical protein QFC21_005820 [Naganishia friedmannii]|uniref:Uncharacterized protein n=1 Tax=Naganishia friedmannii TaxID=89922 RepID=A0ACC2V8Z1_9TREE|nr:hypothetical protein QFC21_005820 [Naganishia friedmannii]
MDPKDAGHDTDEWPEMRAAGHSGGKDKVSWGQDVRSEEEAYLAKLEGKLAKLTLSRGNQEPTHRREPSREDLFDTSLSLASSPSEQGYHSDHNDDSELDDQEEEIDDATAVPEGGDNPGLPLLWDQPPVNVEVNEAIEEKDEEEEEEGEDEPTTNRSLPVTPARSKSLVIQHSSSERPGLTSNDSKVRFFSRVRVTSGKRAVSSQFRQRSPHITSPPIAPTKSEPSSIASSVTMSLRGTPTTSWLFPSMTPIGTPTSETPGTGTGTGTATARDYFSFVSPASSGRRSGTMTPRDPEIEQIAARAAQARAQSWAPNRRISSDAFDKALGRRVTSDGTVVLKTEDGVIWGSWRTRLTTVRWWTWKARRIWYAVLRFWCHADRDDEDGDDDEERRVF